MPDRVLKFMASWMTMPMLLELAGNSRPVGYEVNPFRIQRCGFSGRRLQRGQTVVPLIIQVSCIPVTGDGHDPEWPLKKSTANTVFSS